MKFSDMFNYEDNSSTPSPGSIGSKIRRIRELLGYTQKQLGIYCGFSPNTADIRISQYELDKKTPRDNVLKDIARSLGIDENSLFDADLSQYNRMYHALFDLEDFHGLHPVRKEDGYYLEFSGRTITNQEINKHHYDTFLHDWYEKYQKYLITSSDTDTERKQKSDEYTLWRYQYPKSTAEETSENLKKISDMNKFQAQADEIYADMNSKAELERLNSYMHKTLENIKSCTVPITRESEFILLIRNMVLSGINVERFSPDRNLKSDYDRIHLVSFRTDEIMNKTDSKSLFAIFFYQIEAIQNAGINVRSRITSKDKILYLTYEVASSQWQYFENLGRYWDDIEFIAERKDTWSEDELKELNQKLLANITGENDVVFAAKLQTQDNVDIL